ncbi:hypothetical protein LEN26_006357 [Aphanomyces euteiches]|nr:hypothetical protein AeMF1_003069 [Aphanomyces euteiches]KAH9135841.1 hypothetical protein LEN26_006357 [Aphanomyces euteiches]KAH9191869.1 hypothetical protein AeNC1_006155 [Aphanomyces euteiches]
MGPKKGNTNSKVEAANQRKAAQEAEKSKKKAAQQEAAVAAEWSQGADARSARRAQEEELKRQQADAKKAELRRIQEEEEAAMSGIKSKAKTKAQKDIDKPWEAALAPVAKKSNKGSRAPPPAPKVVAAPAPARAASRNDIVFDERPDEEIFENRNRVKADALEASSVEDALEALGIGGKEPTKNMKAAYMAFEEATMPQLKADYPGLKLSQYKQRLSDMWRRSPQNPMNQHLMLVATLKIDSIQDGHRTWEYCRAFMPSEVEKQARAELQKSSIVVGYDRVDYSTSTKDMNALVPRHGHGTQDQMRKSILAEHSKRHFDLGDVNEKPLSYATSAKLDDPTGELHKYTAKLNVETKIMLTQTSAIVGYEKPQFTTSTKDATKWNREDMRKSIAMREETRKITGPKKCPFVYGDDEINYVSTAKGTMNFDQKDAKCAVMAADVKEGEHDPDVLVVLLTGADLRKCHYSFGHDKLDYTTSSHIPALPSDVYREMTKKHPPVNDPRKTSVYFS